MSLISALRLLKERTLAICVDQGLAKTVAPVKGLSFVDTEKSSHMSSG